MEITWIFSSSIINQNDKLHLQQKPHQYCYKIKFPVIIIARDDKAAKEDVYPDRGGSLSSIGKQELRFAPSWAHVFNEH